MASIPTVSIGRRRQSSRRARIGPGDHGSRISLAAFSRADALPGFLYELANGVIQVTDIPGLFHHVVLRRLNRVVTAYDLAHAGTIHSVGGGAEAKIEMWGRETERHPDLSIYLTPPPVDDDRPWDRWIPEIVAEVVSRSSARRDYEEKRVDYLAAGVHEYWILDPGKRSGVFLVRRADMWIEKRLGIRNVWHTPLLPGFALDLAKLLEQLPRRK